MAEAIVILEKRRSVFGHLRAVAAKSVILSNGDTWTVPGIRRIEQINLVPSGSGIAQFGLTPNGNVVTLTASGPPGPFTFRGAVIGI